jgi:hypothetical protein
MQLEQTATLERYRVAALAVLAYLLAVAGTVSIGMWTIDWQLVYPLDDTYIHLSTARTLADHGLWSAVPTEPSSPSSSVLWTLILAGADAVGLLGKWTPLAINTVLGVVTVFVADRILRVRFPRLGELQRFGLLAALILAASLSVQTVVGMEHALQILAAILLVETGVGTILERSAPDETFAHALPPALIWVFAPLLVAVRFEAAFLVLPVCILLAWYIRFVEGFALGVASMLPVGAFAMYSTSVGNYPLPNSILLKTDAVGIAERASFVDNVLINLLSSPLPVMILMLTGFMLANGTFSRIAKRRAASPTAVAAIIVSLGTALQLLLASTGWLYRYEAYLLGVAFVFFGPYVMLEFGDALEGKVSPKLFRVGKWVVVATIVTRMGVAHFDTVRAMKDRYLEHLLPVEFVTEYFPEAPIMVNDLGLPAWHHEGKVVDVFGLGSNKPIEMRLSDDGYTRQDVLDWAREEGVVLAIHQVEWPFVFDHIPEQWEVVAFWRVPRNVVFGDRIVGFFATDEATREDVHRHLRTFVDERVPDSVETKFYEPGEMTFEKFIEGAKNMGDGSRRRP